MSEKAASCMTSVYIVSPLKPDADRTLRTALPTEPTPDCIGPGSAGSRPAAISSLRNFTTFSPTFCVAGVTGLNFWGGSSLSVITMAAIFSGGQGT